MHPNLLLIHADMLRADCLSPYGNNQVKTPNIQKLADEGMVYANHFCVFPGCAPSRYSLLTGKYPHQHMGLTNECAILPYLNTFPKALKAEGYSTAAVGKMHFTPAYLDVGFDKLVLAEQVGEGRFEDDYHKYLMDCGKLDITDLYDQNLEYRAMASADYYETMGIKPTNLSNADYSTTWITDRLLEQISTWGNDKPNLLMAGYIKPHHPYDAPPPYDTMYDPNEISILPGYTEEVLETDYKNNPGYFDHKTLDKDLLKRITASYYGLVSQIDDGIGRIIGALKQNGLYENTAVIITSDHGDHLGYHHMTLKGNYMYDPVMKIPLIIKYPGIEKTGVSGVLSDNTDIEGEILKICGFRTQYPQNDINGVDSCRKFVFGEDYHVRGETTFYKYMARSERYKLLTDNMNTDVPVMFFDLQNDPFELCNMADNTEYADELARHREAMFDWLLKTQPMVFTDKKANLSKASAIKTPEDISKIKEYMREKFSRLIKTD